MKNVYSSEGAGLLNIISGETEVIFSVRMFQTVGTPKW